MGDNAAHIRLLHLFLPGREVAVGAPPCPRPIISAPDVVRAEAAARSHVHAPAPHSVCPFCGTVPNSRWSEHVLSCDGVGVDVDTDGGRVGQGNRHASTLTNYLEASAALRAAMERARCPPLA